jgi:hypothetical protein
VTLLEQLKKHARAKEWDAALKLLRIDPAEVDELRAKNAELREALEPFARAEEGIARNLRFHLADDAVIYRENGNDLVELRMGDFRRAREALK